ncbi:hypothetical protein IEQ34_000197 [Dendrobium chrysotoxum]|uniref:Uncharacterized protein n=1 Tax=Dendrobium chrysotoxum TaxID=161865 RepID=A0AAV7H9K7_DENCH|nr:hypothetical protein IEQ34_000197 [Dendrobium chrysotoxum]
MTPNFLAISPTTATLPITTALVYYWEEGDNWLLAVPESGVYDLVCGWNETREVLDLLAGVSEEEVEGEGDGEGSNVDDDEVVVEVEVCSFVEQWQCSYVSFMRSN